MILAGAGCANTSNNGSPAPGASSPGASPASPGAASPGASSPGAASPGTATGDAKKIDQFVIGVTGSMGTFIYGDVDNISACHALYDAIFYCDPGTMEPSSDVFESWVWEDDLTLTCTMKDGITFSNGKKANAEDVIWSYMRHFEWGAPIMNNANLVREECKALDEKTAQFKFSTANNNFTVLRTFLFDKEWNQRIGFDSEEWYKPVGSGRYECTEYVQGSHFVLKARDNYWNAAVEGAPVIREFLVKFYPDPSVMYMDLELGNLDLCQVANSTDYSRFLRDGGDGFDVITKPSGSVLFFLFGRNNNPIWNDIRLREAFAVGIDWDAIGRIGYDDFYAPTNSLVPSTSNYYFDPGSRAFDLARGKQLLAEAGYGPGELSLYAITMNNPLYQRLYESFQASAAQLGVEVTVEFADPSTVIAMWSTESTTEYGFWYYIQGSPLQDVNTTVNTTVFGTGIRWYFIPDDQYLDIYKGTSVIDDATRMAANKEIQQYAFDNILLIPISAVQSALGYKTDMISREQIDKYASNATVYHLGHLGMPSAWK